MKNHEYLQERKTHIDTLNTQAQFANYLLELIGHPEVPLNEKDKFMKMVAQALMTTGIFIKFRYDAGNDGVFLLTKSGNIHSAFLKASEWSRQGKYVKLTKGQYTTIIDLKDLWTQLYNAFLDACPSSSVDALRKSRETLKFKKSGSYTVGLDEEPQ